MHPDDLTKAEVEAIAEAGAESAKIVAALGKFLIVHHETLPTELVEQTVALMLEHGRYAVYALEVNGYNRTAVALLASLDQIRVTFRDMVGEAGDKK
jgi:hypothetical protein